VSQVKFFKPFEDELLSSPAGLERAAKYEIDPASINLLAVSTLSASVVYEVIKYYRAFHGFGQAKFTHGGSVLGSSQFSILPQLPPKMLLD